MNNATEFSRQVLEQMEHEFTKDHGKADWDYVKDQGKVDDLAIQLSEFLEDSHRESFRPNEDLAAFLEWKRGQCNIIRPGIHFTVIIDHTSLYHAANKLCCIGVLTRNTACARNTVYSIHHQVKLNGWAWMRRSKMMGYQIEPLGLMDIPVRRYEPIQFKRG